MENTKWNNDEIKCKIKKTTTISMVCIREIVYIRRTCSVMFSYIKSSSWGSLVFFLLPFHCHCLTSAPYFCHCSYANEFLCRLKSFAAFENAEHVTHNHFRKHSHNHMRKYVCVLVWNFEVIKCCTSTCPGTSTNKNEKKKQTNKPKKRKKKIGNHTPNSSNFRLLAEAISHFNRSYFMCVMWMRINVMIHNGKVFCTVKKNTKRRWNLQFSKKIYKWLVCEGNNQAHSFSRETWFVYHFIGL